jgi:hypothetical protein
LGASRVMFSDSFLAAQAVLWGKHDAEATFREGEILVLMSMDPDSAVSQRSAAPFQAKRKAFRDWLKARNITGKQDFDKLSSADRLLLLKNLSELEELEKKESVAPLGIVTHPALFGRELSWSAARVDFWFNRISELSKEASLMNGGQRMPANLENLDLGTAGAATWQFYELDSVIRFGDAEGKAKRLVVASKAPEAQQESARSHFGVSMFAFGDAPPDGERIEDGVYRLPKLERQLQPMLDWLSTNHHDFMRLNDFSEAFSLLRWLKSKDVRINIVQMIGQGPPMATPDQVVRDKGPQVGRQ